MEQSHNKRFFCLHFSITFCGKKCIFNIFLQLKPTLSLHKKSVTYEILCAKICAMDTIASISTPMGTGAIAIVRMSGKQSLDIAFELFENKKLTKENIVSRMLYLGNIKGLGEKCLMVYFKNPHSFTGEDMVEFQVHGGVLLCREVLRLLLEKGARLAENGEFSKRAFLNGKMSLDEAEGIIDVIEATHKAELSAGFELLNGQLLQTVKQMQKALTTTNARLAVTVDYPEYDDESIEKEQTKQDIKEIKNQIEKLLANSEYGKQLKTGVKIALVGKPNVGKSSIMNALLGENRVIVTDIKGTTRDSITESFLYNGIKINLIDTAGIRETEDVVESIGIEKSKESLANADIVLFVLDGSEKENQEDKEIETMLAGKKIITIINKIDKKRLVGHKENEIEVSALTNKNITNLKQKIVDMVIEQNIDTNALVLTNERHVTILKDARVLLKEILLSENLTLDVVSMMVKKVWLTLGKITGNTENEDIINLIFSKFCLGK